MQVDSSVNRRLTPQRAYILHRHTLRHLRRKPYYIDTLWDTSRRRPETRKRLWKRPKLTPQHISATARIASAASHDETAVSPPPHHHQRIMWSYQAMSPKETQAGEVGEEPGSYEPVALGPDRCVFCARLWQNFPFVFGEAVWISPYVGVGDISSSSGNHTFLICVEFTNAILPWLKILSPTRLIATTYIFYLACAGASYWKFKFSGVGNW